jgi:hypothetical protein
MRSAELNRAATTAAPRSPRSRAVTSARAALVVFVLVEAVAAVFFVRVARHRWFRSDEWDFLADRSATDVGDLFRPHNEHWQTIPILVYRALWTLFGLRTYFPYRLLAVLVHVAVAALLWVVMRRAGTAPWLATAAASLFALFGEGYDNITWAFQIGFVGSLALGLVHLLLADHDGPVARRDALGIGAGLAGLMCSGIGVTMVGVVALAVLLRRGWRAAALHAVPLTAAFVVWWLVKGRDSYDAFHADALDVVRFVRAGVRDDFEAMGQWTPVAVALGLVLVVGGVLVARDARDAAVRRSLAAPFALMLGTVGFLAVTSLGRSGRLGVALAGTSRYLHLGVAMLLPAIALAAGAIARRWRHATPLLVAVLVAGIPGNVDTGADRQPKRVTPFRAAILSLPRQPLAREVPRSLRPVQPSAPEVTLGWLLDGVADGRIPEPPAPTASERATYELLLSLSQAPARRPLEGCRPLERPVQRTLRAGDAIGIRNGEVRITRLGPGPVISDDMGYGTTFRTGDREHVVEVLAGPLEVDVRPVPNAFLGTVALCSAPR